jgi:hypothetical protein
MAKDIRKKNNIYVYAIFGFARQMVNSMQLFQVEIKFGALRFMTF